MAPSPSPSEFICSSSNVNSSISSSSNCNSSSEAPFKTRYFVIRPEDMVGHKSWKELKLDDPCFSKNLTVPTWSKSNRVIERDFFIKQEEEELRQNHGRRRGSTSEIKKFTIKRGSSSRNFGDGKATGIEDESRSNSIHITSNLSPKKSSSRNADTKKTSLKTSLKTSRSRLPPHQFPESEEENVGDTDCILFQLLNLNPATAPVIVDPHDEKNSQSASTTANTTGALDEGKVLEFLEGSKSNSKGQNHEALSFVCQQRYRFDAFASDLLHPLHMACALGASYTIVKKLYKAYPDAIHYVSNVSGMNCLHYVCIFTRASLKVINFLIRQSCKTAEVLSATTTTTTTTTTSHSQQSHQRHNKDKNKEDKNKSILIEQKCYLYHRTPLHYACACSPTLECFNHEVVLLLTEIFPNAVMALDIDGNTPLHLACSVDKPCLDVIEDLTTVNPKACIVQCKETLSTPLHLICNHDEIITDNDKANCSSTKIVDIVKDLVHSNPAALQMQNKNGLIPLFVAVEKGACFKVCKILATKYPESLLVTNRLGQTPYECAKMKQTKLKDKKSQHQRKIILDFLYPYEEHDEDSDYQNNCNQQQQFNSTSSHSSSSDGNDSFQL